MATRIQVRRGTTSQWNTANPTLEEGEIGYNTTLGQMKIGDGTSVWADLDYIVNSASLDTSLGSYIPDSEKSAVNGVAELDASKNILAPAGIIFEGTANDHETTLAVTDPTADRTITFPDATGTVQLRVTDVSDTEIGYLNGVTSAIQTQIDLLAPKADPTFTGTISAASLTLSGDLTVNGTTTNINSTNLVVEDKNIIFGDVATPTDTTADGGGITLKGATDKTFNWVDSTDAWTSSEHINLASGKSLYLNGTLLKDTAETLTNKTLTTPTINGPTITATGQTPTIHGIYLPAPHNIIFEGTTADDFETTLQAGEPTADRTITLPDATGTLQLRVADVDDTEIGYLNGVTSAIQTQLDGKVDESLFDAKGDILVASADNTPAKLGVGTNGYILTANSGATNGVEWAAAPISLPSQTGNSGKYLTTDGSTASWGTVSSYSAPTLGSTSIASGATVTTITGLTLSSPTITGSLTAGGGTGTSGQVLASTGSGVQWSTPSAGAAFSEFMLIGC
jgi:hypothetical protein